MLSVIIPVWDQTPERAALTEQVVNRVWDVAATPTEVLVVDNGSKVRQHLKASARTDWYTNKGIAPAFNEGMRMAHGDFLCFLNSDCLVEPGWDKALVECADSGDYVACPWTNGEKSDGLGITGWCFVVSKATATVVGPFDETFVPAFYEDTDWFQRLYDAGGQLWSVKAARVHHTRGSDRDLLFVANRVRFAWKHKTDPNDAPHFWKQPLADWLP
jgi:GT2 family glycosyltransferase